MRNFDKETLKDCSSVCWLTSFGRIFQSLGPLMVNDFSYNDLIDLALFLGKLGTLAFMPSLSENVNCILRSFGEWCDKIFHMWIME